MIVLAPTTPETERTTATATFYVQKGTNDTWFRCEAPADAVGGRVSYITDAQIDRATMYPNRDTGLPWHAEFTTPDGNTYVAETKKAWNELSRGRLAYTDVRVAFPEHEGAAVWTRPDGRRALLASFMRNEGIVTIAETDDNYMADKWWNLHQRQVDWSDEAKDVVCRAMASMDRNVYSTSWLRDRYFKEFKRRLGKQNLPEMFVCRNHIPRSAWPERDEGDGHTRVGFMGSGSHVWDIEVAYVAFRDAKQLGGAQVVMIGYNPADPDREPDSVVIDDEQVALRSEKSIKLRNKWRTVVDTHIPWINPGEYRRAALPIDIGLAPIVRADDFTLGKSDAKALEYTISGAACVLSTCGIYAAGGWKHEVNCLMASSWRDMAAQTLRLVRDPKLRFELVSAAQEMVWNDRNGDALAAEWGAALA